MATREQNVETFFSKQFSDVPAFLGVVSPTGGLVAPQGMLIHWGEVTAMASAQLIPSIPDIHFKYEVIAKFTNSWVVRDTLGGNFTGVGLSVMGFPPVPATNKPVAFTEVIIVNFGADNKIHTVDISTEGGPVALYVCVGGKPPGAN